MLAVYRRYGAPTTGRITACGRGPEGSRSRVGSPEGQSKEKWISSCYRAGCFNLTKESRHCGNSFPLANGTAEAILEGGTATVAATRFYEVSPGL